MAPYNAQLELLNSQLRTTQLWELPAWMSWVGGWIVLKNRQLANQSARPPLL